MHQECFAVYLRLDLAKVLLLVATRDLAFRTLAISSFSSSSSSSFHLSSTYPTRDQIFC